MIADKKTRFLLSFLMVLVERAGGQLEINNLEEYGGRAFDLQMEMAKDRKSVTLRTIELKPDKSRIN